MAGSGFGVRNEDGIVLGAGAFNLDGATINEVEEKALKEGHPISGGKGLKRSLLKSNLIVGELQGIFQPPWNLRLF
ncbi:hypothetical protein ACFX15_031960 [Malus domestica]